jgi:hypothetical protein
MSSLKPKRPTGPRTVTGKARSSMNALKSGIYSKSLVIPGEDPEHLAALTNEYFERFRPTVPEQRDQVDILIRSTWTLRRLAAAETQVWIYDMEREYKPSQTAPLGKSFRGCDRTLTRLCRMVSATQRSYRDALSELDRMQSVEPAADPTETVSYAPEAAPPAPSPEPKAPPQQSEKTPVTPSHRSSSEVDGTKWKAPPEYHKPDVRCPYRPIDPMQFNRCPVCFPRETHIRSKEIR